MAVARLVALRQIGKGLPDTALSLRIHSFTWDSHGIHMEPTSLQYAVVYRCWFLPLGWFGTMDKQVRDQHNSPVDRRRWSREAMLRKNKIGSKLFWNQAPCLTGAKQTKTKNRRKSAGGGKTDKQDEGWHAPLETRRWLLLRSFLLTLTTCQQPPNPPIPTPKHSPSTLAPTLTSLTIPSPALSSLKEAPSYL